MNASPHTDKPTLAGWWRRCFAWWYELLLLIPVILLVQVLYQLSFQLLTGAPVTAVSINTGLRGLNFVVLVSAIFGYLTLCWRRGGQTLAMKTWRLRLVSQTGIRPDWRQLGLRFTVAALFYCPCIPLWVLARHDGAWSVWASAATAWLLVPFLWALIDRDRQLLHDRIAGTRILRLRARVSANIAA